MVLSLKFFVVILTVRKLCAEERLEKEVEIDTFLGGVSQLNLEISLLKVRPDCIGFFLLIPVHTPD